MASAIDTPAQVKQADAASTCTHPEEVLRFRDVSVRFDEKTALENVSFEVNRGETIVLCGAASSGKTVLVKTAIGLIQPASGDVYLLGQSITFRQEEDLYPLRRCAGALFQEGRLFDSLTILENVAYPLLNAPGPELPESEVESRVKEALDFVGLDSVQEKTPDELSGGMRRRVGIARAIVTRPPLILYDSPTAGLDPITAYRIVSLLIRQRDTWNTTSIVITHRHQDGYLLAKYRYDPQRGKVVRENNLQPPTRFFVLREGRMVFNGSVEEMRQSADPYVARFAGRKIAVTK